MMYSCVLYGIPTYMCARNRYTKGKEREVGERKDHGVCAVAAGDQKGRPIRLTGSRCELHFSFSSAPATATIITNKTNHVLLLICRNKDCILRILFYFFSMRRAAGTVQRYVHKTQVRYRPSSASLSAVPAQWPQELAGVVFSRREKQQQNLPELRPRQLASRAHCKGRSLSSSGPAAERNIFDGDEDEGTPLITGDAPVHYCTPEYIRSV